MEAVSQVANERMVDVFEHPPFADDVAHALGFDDWFASHQYYIHSAGTRASRSNRAAAFHETQAVSLWHTFIFADVLQRERQVGVLALDDADFAKSTATDDSQQAEVIEIYWMKSRTLAF